jgi:hypothetical protein
MKSARIRNMPFWIRLRIRRDMIDFRPQKSCMRCQWHCMHEKFLLGSPFKFICYGSGGLDQFGNIYVFDRYSL